MDENHVMSTSILQFLEDFKTHMKNNTALKHEENNALLSDFRPLSKENDRGMLFESENPDNMMFENDFIHDEHVKLFDSKLNIKEDSFEDNDQFKDEEESKFNEEDFRDEDIDEKIKKRDKKAEVFFKENDDNLECDK